MYCGNTNLVSCHAESPQLKKEAELSYFSQARERLETNIFVFCILAKSLAKFVFAFTRKYKKGQKNSPKSWRHLPNVDFSLNFGKIRTK